MVEPVAQNRLSFYLAHRLWFEIGGSVLLTLAIISTNATTEWMDAARHGEQLGWIPFLKELTSGVIILALIPCVVWVHSRWPIRFGSTSSWTKLGLIHVMAFLGFTFLHVVGMNGLRYLLAPVLGLSYQPTDLMDWFEWVYEARKDLLTYLAIVAVVYTYEFVLTRLQGEASLMDAVPVPAPRDRFLVKMLQREFLVPVSDVQWIESARNYAVLHVDDRCYPIRQTMQKLEADLAAQGFRRVHRSAIVQLSAVQGLKEGNGALIAQLANGEEVPVGPSYAADMRRQFA